jgi:L-ribulose-5-phosphate 3-epimerase
MKRRIGFMQGRFSPLAGGRIQSFPWTCWRDEFATAAKYQFGLMEWTLDQEGLHDNPLLTAAGQLEIAQLRRKHGVEIASLTGDCFMQSPFWKAEGPARMALLEDLRSVAKACSSVGIGLMVIPLVDNGQLNNRAEEDTLIGVLEDEANLLETLNVKIAFESDFAPLELTRLIDRLTPALFGINYDIGNSASLGLDPVEEITSYGHRIVNVHVKDRLLGGTTVPLGTGNADFDAVFASLARAGYKGNYILQTARASDGGHAEALTRYRDMVSEWIVRHGA